jgi:tetratricopeptide (TPR) repeat protein
VPEKQRAMLICLLLAVITLALYWPATHFDFTNYDDPEYIIYNPPIQHGAALAWAFKTRHASNWHPLTWVSHTVDYALYGLNPGGHHLTNLLFHTANVVLLFLVLCQWTGAAWRGALVAALFAWHPLHVESVAWVSERKDVLSAFFWLLTLAAYGCYVKNLKFQISNFKFFYIASIVLFALGLLSKPMVVTLPFVLLLLDFWPLKRKASPGLFLEKIPFFALAALECAATLWAQRGANSVVSFGILPLSARIANALVSCVLYLWKMLWPVDLALPYPYSHLWTFWPAAGAGCLFLVISAGAILRARRQPWLIVGWLWFLGTLTPVIGLAQTGIQPMADRYSYVPLIGIFIMAAWAIPGAWTRWPRPGLVFGAVVAGALGFLLAGAEAQLQYWRDSVTLFSHTVAVTRNNILAEYNLAEALARQGDEAEAVVHYQRALAIEPNRVEAHYNCQTQAHYNLGLIFRARQQWAEAEAQFRACLREDPSLARARDNLDAVLREMSNDKARMTKQGPEEGSR